MNSKIDFIKEELSKTGFQLEDKVASVFYELKNFEVEPNYHFTDWQTGDTRELDMRATYRVTSLPIKIEYIILVECKSLPGHAWTFIRSQGDHILFKDATSIWDDVGRLGRQKPVVKILEPTIKVNKIIADTFSHRYKEIILDKRKSNKRDDNILSSVIKLAKVMYYEQKRERRIDSILASKMKDNIDHIRIYYPLIVFEGDLYEATMLPDVKLKRISSAHLSHFSIQRGKEINMVIDVVKYENLKDFIQRGLLIETSQIKEKEGELRDSHLSLIQKIKFKEKIISSFEMLSDFMPWIPRIKLRARDLIGKEKTEWEG